MKLIFILRAKWINKTCRIWAYENPREIHKHPLHPLKVTVWWGVISLRIIGPYFFEDVDGNTVTVNGNTYRQMLQEYTFRELEDMNTENIWFPIKCSYSSYCKGNYEHAFEWISHNEYSRVLVTYRGHQDLQIWAHLIFFSLEIFKRKVYNDKINRTGNYSRNQQDNSRC